MSVSIVGAKIAGSIIMRFAETLDMQALAGKDSPTADDIKAILESVESEYAPTSAVVVDARYSLTAAMSTNSLSCEMEG